MPESEPKPKLIEIVAPGAGQGWKATLRNGKAAVIHEIPAPAAEAAAAVPRIQRLADHRHPALAPVLAWGTDPNGIWVAVEPNEGTPLGTMLSRGPLTPPAAAALGATVLSGVAALHEAGIAMGGFGAAAIRVTGNGEVRLTGHPAAAVRGAPSQSDLRADVRSCGMAICAAFGVDPAGAPAPPTIPPGLVVTMRSMASGAMGPAADRAQGALREMAAALLAPDRMTAAQSELALRAGGREMPSITPFLPKETYPPAPTAAQRQPWSATAPPPQQPWGTTVPAPAPAPAEPLEEPPAPPPYTPAVPDETPIRAPASYEAPARPLETYPPNAPPPYVPPPRQEEPPAPPPASYEPAPRAPETFPTVPPPVEAPAPPGPVPTWDANPAAPSSPQATWGGVPIAPPPEAPQAPPTPPAAPETWEAIPSAAAPSEAAPSPPASNPPPLARPEPAPAESKPTWTAVPTPTWTPSESEPAETPAPAEAEPAPVTPAYVAPAPAPAPVPTPARKPPAPRRPVHDQPTERPPWLVPAIAVVVILLLLGVGGGIFLANRGGPSNKIATNSPTTSPKTSPKTSPSAPPSAVTGLQTVPTYAPLASAPLKSVQFCLPTATCVGGTSADTNCQVSGPCHIDIGIYWAGQGSVTQLTYTVKFFDRCTGKDQTVFNRLDTTKAISQQISWIPAPTGGFPVTLPSGAKAAAIVAVVTTDKGVTAASKPYDLPGSAASCA